jgi:hypothetical protein
MMEMKIKQAAHGQQDSACMLKLFEFMMTISPSTSACERGFSRMNYLKSKYRSTLSQPCPISQNSFFFLIRKIWGNRGMVKKTRKFFNPIITKLCSGQRPFLYQI